MKYSELPIGSKFKWKTNLGAGDTFRKMSETEVKNLTLKTEQRGLGYFTPNDPVTKLP